MKNRVYCFKSGDRLKLKMQLADVLMNNKIYLEATGEEERLALVEDFVFLALSALPDESVSPSLHAMKVNELLEQTCDVLESKYEDITYIDRSTFKFKVATNKRPVGDIGDYIRKVERAVIEHNTRLSGYELQFLRERCRYTTEEASRRFYVSELSITNWEGAGRKIPELPWVIEKDLRLELASRRKEINLLKLYEYLSRRSELKPSKEHKMIKVIW